MRVSFTNYRDVTLLWATNVFDVPISGLCQYRGELCLFQRADPDLQCVTLVHLGPLQRLAWRCKKLWFEICVGRHCSRPSTEFWIFKKVRRPRFLKTIYYGRR